jgi:ribosomal protein S12 methylthiotransferase
MNRKHFYLASLGCAKNTVDSQSMAQILEQTGYTPAATPGRADLLIVNTCGFIASARAESISVLQDLAKKKKPGQLLIAAGCLTQRDRDLVVREVPGVDGLISTRRWMDIAAVVQELRGENPPQPLYHLPDVPDMGGEVEGIQRLAVQGASAYLKIADGCRRPCAFCAIPLIKGTTVSRPIDAVIEEAHLLEDAGMHEIILIAQDTTDYGSDLGMKDGLATLLERLTEETPAVEWIRVMYAYPGYVTDRLIDIMATHPQIVPYLDMPLQHAHPDVLKRMKRPSDMNWVHSTLAKMRAAIPNLTLRSTFIVGYSGETETEFQSLLDFLEEIRFDRVGAFTFCLEPGTAAAELGDTVPAEVKEERLGRLMATQEKISLQINQSFIGKTLDVLVEGTDNGISIGRSYRDAPEIDGLVIVDGEVPAGEMVKVRISGAMVHDLSGDLI